MGPRRQLLACGLLAATLGCGQASDGSPQMGSAGHTGDVGHVGDSETCRVICNGCADGEEAAACDADCQERIGELSGGLDFDSCPEELAVVGECLQAAGCVGQSCDVPFLAWFTCVGGLSR